MINKYLPLSIIIAGTLTFSNSMANDIKYPEAYNAMVCVDYVTGIYLLRGHSINDSFDEGFDQCDKYVDEYVDHLVKRVMDEEGYRKPDRSQRYQIKQSVISSFKSDMRPVYELAKEEIEKEKATQ